MRAQSRVPVRIGLSAACWTGRKRKRPACLITEDIPKLPVEACEIQSLGLCGQLWSVDADAKREGELRRAKAGLGISSKGARIGWLRVLCVGSAGNTRKNQDPLIRALFPEGSIGICTTRTCIIISKIL